MTDQNEIQEMLHDFERNPTYEERIIAFYDFLGWRSKIEEAGIDSTKIGKLRRMILRHTRSLGGQQQYSAPAIRFTSFSDNIVVSQPPDPTSVLHLLGTLAAFQLASAGDGFLVRGGVTIGLINHDSASVFGPGLNRAYELESEIADVPRIIIDKNVLGALETRPFFVRHEDGLDFIDPFSVEFVRLLASFELTQTNDVYATLGFPNAGKRSLAGVPSDAILRFALNGLKQQIRGPLADKEWRKVAWVYDRLASALGVAPAQSYPRLQPGNQN